MKKPDYYDEFHKHLDACMRCRSRPFDLCLLGAELLKRAAEDVAK